MLDTSHLSSSDANAAISAALLSGVAPSILASYARWFQLETWLRQLVHLEMTAAHGRAWIGHLKGKVATRATKNAKNFYMLSPDEEALLAYSDVSDLFSLIEQNWEYFETALLPKVRWLGCADELLDIRNRIAHTRRPHTDDLFRLEQILRNLEPGAKRILYSYSETTDEVDQGQIVLNSWIGKTPPWHQIATHAYRQYDTSFRCFFSLRPWKANRSVRLGEPGLLVHALWRVREGYVTPHRVWDELGQQGFDPDLIVHYAQDIDSHVNVVFSGMDNASEIAEAIKLSFQAVLGNIERYTDDSYERWKANAAHLDPRCHIDDIFAHADRAHSFSVFNAERNALT